MENNIRPNDTYFKLSPENQDEKKRLDLFLSESKFFSRSYAAKIVSDGFVFVNGKNVKPSYKIKAKDLISGRVPHTRPLLPQAENIPLNILYEDDFLAVINKPANMVVHPSPGHESNTLVNALLYNFENIPESDDPLRPGIVHRLDKDTSGAIIIAKTGETLLSLKNLFLNKEIEKKYFAVVFGHPPEKGKIEKPVGRHCSDRKKMGTYTSNGRYALTYYNVIEYFEDFSFVEINIATGRTHQIRVHMSDIGHPLAGDSVYGYKSPVKHIKNTLVKSVFKNSVNRQMLHSYSVSFMHPFTGEVVSVNADKPADMKEFISKLNLIREEKK
ncbi:MAG: RluA family pseudouridine synthase [Thermodesulfobacteriota bacterium]